MKAKLYSPAHLEVAKEFFYDKFNKNWLDLPWTDQEINTCKLHEMGKFIKNPSVTTYPSPSLLSTKNTITELFVIPDRYLTPPSTHIISQGHSGLLTLSLSLKAKKIA